MTTIQTILALTARSWNLHPTACANQANFSLRDVA